MMDLVLEDDYLEWQQLAACKGMPASVFYAENPSPACYTLAKETCKSCPVMYECQDHALTKREDYGVWGGLTEEERQSLCRRRQKSIVAFLQNVGPTVFELVDATHGEQ
jgi:WhiB family redox-sensing transcriptional regulator